VPLSFKSRRADDITVVKCTGRIVEGAESAALQLHVNDLVAENPYVLLDLGDVDFIDSSGLGLLVRCLLRTRNANGIFKVCGVSQRISEALRVTKLDTVFESYGSEAEAIVGFYLPSSAGNVPPLKANILCAEQSMDVLAYVGALLRQAGYRVVTTGNLADGLTLLTATRPKLVVIGATLRAARDTRAAEAFNKLADTLAVIELPAEFSSHDAGDAGRQFLDQVHVILGDANARAAEVSRN
jgi:anti-sigma B factor antagonist